MDDVKKQIRNSDLVLVDLTGRNPNVYYEAGLADAWGRKWIVLAQSAEDVTFDMRQIRFIRYENRIGADVELSANLRSCSGRVARLTVARALALVADPNGDSSLRARRRRPDGDRPDACAAAPPSVPSAPRSWCP